MARPIKDGFGYFPKDTDFYSDYKVRLLRSEFGAKGMYLLDYLLCELYGKNGYFLPWDRNVQLLVADAVGCGCEPQYISEFIKGATRCSFFDERVRDVFGVLTSAGIQRRYIRMFKSRDKIQIIKEYWLLDVDNEKDVPAGVLEKCTFKNLKSTEYPYKSTGNPFKSTVYEQSKLEETNVSQSKENCSGGCDARGRAQKRNLSGFGDPNPDDVESVIEEADGYNDTMNKIGSMATEARERLRRTVDLLCRQYWDKQSHEFNYAEIYNLISCLNHKKGEFLPDVKMTDDDVFLLTEAFKASATAGKSNLNYIRGVYRRYRERGIRTADDYIQNDFDRSSRK